MRACDRSPNPIGHTSCCHAFFALSAPSSRHASGGSHASPILGLRVVSLVFAEPEVLEQGRVAGDLGDEDDNVTDGSLGAALPDDGEGAGQDGVEDESHGHARPEKDDSLDPEEELQGGDDEDEQGADNDDVGRVVERREGPVHQRLHHGHGHLEDLLRALHDRPADDLEGGLRVEEVVLEELYGGLG